MLVPPPKGTSTASAFDHRREDGFDVGLRARVHDQVGQAAEVAGPDTHQVAQALAVAVHDAVEVVVADPVGPQGRDQLPA